MNNNYNNPSQECPHEFRGALCVCGNNKFQICLKCFLIKCSANCNNHNKSPQLHPANLPEIDNQLGAGTGRLNNQIKLSPHESYIYNLDLIRRYPVQSQNQNQQGKNEGRTSFAKLKIEELNKAFIGHIESPSEIYLLTEKALYHLQKIDKILFSYGINEGFTKMGDNAKVGDYCVMRTLYSTNNDDNRPNWSRAQIIELNDETDITLKFIDYGRTGKSNLANLNILPDDLSIKQFPQCATATPFHLINVKPKDDSSNWSEEASEFLRDLLFPLKIVKYRVDFYCKEKKNLFGNIYIEPMNSDVGTILFNKELASRTLFRKADFQNKSPNTTKHKKNKNSELKTSPSKIVNGVKGLNLDENQENEEEYEGDENDDGYYYNNKYDENEINSDFDPEMTNNTANGNVNVSAFSDSNSLSEEGSASSSGLSGSGYSQDNSSEYEQAELGNAGMAVNGNEDEEEGLRNINEILRLKRRSRLVKK